MRNPTRPSKNRAAKRFTLGGSSSSEVVIGRDLEALCTEEMFIEAVHFDPSYTTALEIGHKALAASLSDLASAGAKPKLAQVSFGLRQETQEVFLEELIGGIKKLARRYGVGVTLGQRFHSPSSFFIHLNCVGVGRHFIGHSGAKPGNLIALCGALGRSAAGLTALKSHGRKAIHEEPSLTRAHLLPEPRVKEGLALLATGGVTAMIDIADGLASDLHELTTCSGVGAKVIESELPIPEEVALAGRNLSANAKAWVLYGGEEYSLLLTLEPGKFEKARRRLRHLGSELVAIGEVRPKKEGVTLLKADGTRTSFDARLWHPFVRRRTLR